MLVGAARGERGERGEGGGEEELSGRRRHGHG
jgi:hypothetical protein